MNVYTGGAQRGRQATLRAGRASGGLGPAPALLLPFPAVRDEAEGKLAEQDRRRVARNNLLRSDGAELVRLALAWVTCPTRERGRYLRAMGMSARALRRALIEAGLEMPSARQIERDEEHALLANRKGARTK